jgi:hypothetical protein
MYLSQFYLCDRTVGVETGGRKMFLSCWLSFLQIFTVQILLFMNDISVQRVLSPSKISVISTNEYLVG